MNNKLQDKFIETQIWGETAEKTPVYGMNTTVSYRVAAEKSAWVYANVSGADSGLITDDIVASGIKDAMTTFPAEQVTVRANIEPKALECLNQKLADKYGEGVVTATHITIADMDFMQEYNDAIAKKSNAAKHQEEQAITNQTNIAKAEADKKIAILQAEQKAEAERIAAEGHAKALLIEAEAEAEANRKLSESLTDNVLKNRFYETWNGVLPKAMSDGTVITNVGD